jgi:hypothetical protein
MLDREAQTMLNDLRWHGDDAYLIDCKDGIWVAPPKNDPFAIISRDSNTELRIALREDYAKRAGRRFGGNNST